ncbi:pentapeptide repeat-containing protein [Rhodococcus sp. NPDC077669]|uniref:pentapeptide repeat-containing protein n=1 Tax=Rhodococcus sp. NPDC077669 TaxID=3155174 RepID=UPI00341FB015
MPTPRTTRARRVPGHIAGRTHRRTAPAAQAPPSPANTETPADSAPRPDITGKSHTSFWIRDVAVPLLIAVITGGIVAWGTIDAQKDIDDARADRLLRAANLTFVRDKSSPDPDLPRPFNGIDLAGQNLRGLELANADLSRANLNDADLAGADLSGASLNGADLEGANLESTNLAGADLAGAYPTKICWSSATLWGSWGMFQPPPSDKQTCDRFPLKYLPVVAGNGR